MPKLCQILAIEKQQKTNSGELLTKTYQTLAKNNVSLLEGLSRTYTSATEDGERFPNEKKEVQIRVVDSLKQIVSSQSPLYDLVATRDNANTVSRADVEIDGKVILKNVPVTTLLYLEKQLIDLHTVIGSLPELPQDQSWHYDANMDCFATEPVETAKIKKVAKPFVKAEATEHHPAQVEVVYDDVVQGYWTKTDYSGALPRDRKRELRERVETLLAAVKFARELANQTDAPKFSVAKEVFGYIFS